MGITISIFVYGYSNRTNFIKERKEKRISAKTL